MIAQLNGYGQEYFDPEGNALPGVRDFAINLQTGQFYRTPHNGIAMTHGRDAIRQAVELSIGLLLGEWFLDTTLGFPMFEQVLVKSPNIPAIKDLFRTRIEAVPGVVTCTKLDLDYNRSTRKLTVSFVANTDLGEISGSLRR